jgi:hypothetical protein
MSAPWHPNSRNQDYYYGIPILQRNDPGPALNTLSGLLGRQTEQNEVQRMTQMAAQRLAALGPQGQQWAEMVQKDPRAALRLADEYGGFGAIEQRLLQAQSAGNAQAAIGRMLDSGASPQDIVKHVLVTQGAEAAEKTAKALGTGGPSLRSGPNNRIMQINTDENGNAIASLVPGQPEPIVSGVVNGLDPVSARMLRGKYESGAKDFIVQRNYYEAAAAAAAEAAKDPSSPGSVDFALVQAYGKMLDPNSVVRNEEGKFIVESQSSTVTDKVNQFVRLFSAAGTLNPTARLNLMKQIEAQYRQAENRHRKYLAEVDEELGALEAGGFARNLADPIGIGVSEAQIDFGPWERSKSSGNTPDPNSDLSAMESASVGSVVTLSDGRRVVKIGTDEYDEVD